VRGEREGPAQREGEVGAGVKVHLTLPVAFATGPFPLRAKRGEGHEARYFFSVASAWVTVARSGASAGSAASRRCQ
jgi:hypothetical protein